MADPAEMANETSGGTSHPKDGPTPAGASAPPRDASGTPVAPGNPSEDEPPEEGVIALGTEMADADSVDADPPGGSRPLPQRPAPTPERR
jgi:hypothetical protein